MIVQLFNKPHILYQTREDELPEPALAVHVDNSPLIVLSQEGWDICINFETVPELCKLLKQLAKEPK